MKKTDENSRKILAIKTDENPTEIYLLAENGGIFREKKWEAGRNLARDLLAEIEKLLNEKNENDEKIPENLREKSAENSDENSAKNSKKLGENSAKNFAKIGGIIVFEGPGSFTGLRIGITVANAISYAENVKIVGVNGENWLKKGLKKLSEKSENFREKTDEKSEKKTDENGVIFARKSELQKRAKLQIVVPKYGGEAHITAPKK